MAAVWIEDVVRRLTLELWHTHSFESSLKLSDCERQETQFLRFRHSHGGTSCGSAHKPFLASRALIFYRSESRL